MSTKKSAALFNRAQKKIPGGVNSPVRAWQAVGGTPRFIARAKGPYLIDAGGKRYPDFSVMGAVDFGSCPTAIVRAIAQRLRERRMARHELEVLLAEKCRFMCLPLKLRLVSSGTEAAMSAIRLARAHQADQDHQIRRLLPRPLRRFVGQSGFRHRDFRIAR
jgi:glutamate-1-semialdehyde 2,1-aminomutase